MISLHVGIMKTGSSSIQRYFLENSFRELHFQNVNKFVSEPDWLDRMQTLLDQAPSAKEHFLLSSEGLLGNGSLLYPELRERSNQLCDLLGGRGPFQVVVYFRPQTEWLESMARQGVQAAAFSEVSGCISPLIASKFFRFSELLKALIGIFGAENIVVRAQSGESDAVITMLRILELPAIGHRQAKRMNVSLSPVELDLLTQLRKREHTETWHPLLARWFFQRFLKEGRSRSYSVLPAHVQQLAKDMVLEDWQELTELAAKTKNPSLEEFHANGKLAASFQAADFYDPNVEIDLLREEFVDILSQVIPALRPQILDADRTKKSIWRRSLSDIFRRKN